MKLIETQMMMASETTDNHHFHWLDMPIFGDMGKAANLEVRVCHLLDLSNEGKNSLKSAPLPGCFRELLNGFTKALKPSHQRCALTRLTSPDPETQGFSSPK